MDLEEKVNDEDISRINGELVFNPYNDKNIEITLNDIQSILKKYGVNYTIHNIELFKRAFIHKSYCKRPMLENKASDITIVDKPYDCLPLKTKSNERLEFIGDGILECITKYYLYRRFPKAEEGFMTEKKIALVKNEHIGKLAYELRLFLDVNKIIIKDEDKWFENIFVTGPGFQMAQIFVEKIFEQHVDWTKLINTDDNYKNQLQVIIQKEFKITPEYLEISHDQEIGYEMGVYICIGQSIHNIDIASAIDFNNFNNFTNIHKYLEDNEKVLVFLGKGLHKIKKKAEQIACDEAIKKIM
jgi:dsRNA-specific ribonuclease